MAYSVFSKFTVTRHSRLLFAIVLLSLTQVAFASISVVVQPYASLRQIAPKFFGANVLFWIDDEAALRDGKTVEALKELPAGLLRYPGGSAADNFHWENHTLDDPHSYPFRGGPGTLDFDQFMTLTRQVGAEAVVVVNTESWVWRGNITGGAKEAADWVRYCKTKGYHVRYWEIGNETYLHTAMTAREYADLVNRYAAAMKAVDPSIKIGANGSWDAHFVWRKDRLSAGEQEKLDRLQGSSTPIHTIREIARKAGKSVKVHRPAPANAEQWWPTLARICGGNIDFLIVHDYFAPGRILQFPQHLRAIKAIFKKRYPDKTYPVLMSEYNVGRNVEVPKQPLALFDIEGAMLKGGVDCSCFWPLNTKADHWDARAMLNSAKQPQAAYEILHFLARQLIGATLVKTDQNALGAYAIRKDGKLSVFLSGRTLRHATMIEVRLHDASAQSAVVQHCSINDYGEIKTQEIRETLQGDAITVNLKSGQFVVVNVRLKNR